jgi:putative transposase
MGCAGLKISSSKWMKERGEAYKDFYWQDDYGAFSVDPKRVDYVVRYIENQHAHHQTISFQDEYRSILKAYKIDYNEKYIWD